LMKRIELDQPVDRSPDKAGQPMNPRARQDGALFVSAVERLARERSKVPCHCRSRCLGGLSAANLQART
jgi:hypothetical protein